MDFIGNLAAVVAGQIFNDLVSLIVAFTAVKALEALYKKRKYGGWTLIVQDATGKVVTKRLVGMKKMEAVLDDESELSVFIKGVSSPFAWINIDPVTKGREVGLLTILPKVKEISVDLSKNPPAPPKKVG